LALSLYEKASEAATYIRKHTDREPLVGLILGSGLGSLASRVSDSRTIPYDQIPHFPTTTVPGHAGQLVVGELSQLSICAMRGRFHFYEGYSAREITLPVRIMRLLGAQTLIVTNAAGGVRPGMQPGTVMGIKDHIFFPGLAGHHPLRGANDERFGARFFSMHNAYDQTLLNWAQEEAHTRHIPFTIGTYAMVSGPSFETPAEIRFLRAIHVDAVGMSTAPEVVVARHMGMQVLGLSLITNVALDETGETARTRPVHEEVLEIASKVAPRMEELITGVLQRLAQTMSSKR